MACHLIEYPTAFDQAGKLYHQLPGKEILYVNNVIPIPSILGKLPTVHAGDTVRHWDHPSLILWLQCGINRFNRHIARADTSPRCGDGRPMYFVNSWAL